MRERFGDRTAAFPGAECLQRRILEEDDPLARLARLLLLGLPAEQEDAARLLAPAGIGELVSAGFLVANGGTVRAPWVTMPHDGLLLVADRREAPYPPADVVAGVSPSAVATAWLTPRRAVRVSLDLGTGCGIQALLAAAHSDQVVGVDVNERALALAEVNACLNGITNALWAEGSWLEPVIGRRFDLIVANPPYVISPDSDYLYRDSGLPPATLARELITALPAHLEEGGFAQVMLNWDHARTGDWSESIRGWLSGCGCDALILRLGVDDTIDYCANWNAPLLREGAEAFEEALDRWIAYHRELGIEAIAWGVVLIRRRSDARNWVHAIDVGAAPSGPAGDHVLRLFDARDLLADLDDADELLDEVFELVPGHRIDQTLTYPDARYHSHPAVVRVSPGLELRAAVNPSALPVLFRCDGRTTLRALVGEDDQLVPVVGAAARELLATGLLVRSL